jgi:hypothetical protein
MRLAPVIGRQPAFALLAGVVLSAAFVVPVFGAATVTHFNDTYVAPPENIIDDCTGLAGTVAATGVLIGTSTETAKGFHFEASNHAELTFAFVDGSYGTGTVDEHLSFNTGSGATVFTNAHYDTVDIRSSDGTPLFPAASLRLVEHFTVTSDGVDRADFEIGHFRGGC